MKREYKYWSVFLIMIIFAAINAVISFAMTGSIQNVETYSFKTVISTLITSILTWFSGFVIASGLINNRFGSVSDYLNQAKRIDGKVIIVSLLMVLINALLSLGSIGISANLVLQQDFTSLLSTAFLIFVLSIIFSVISQYTAHILADPRNKNLGVGEAIKNIFKTGLKLLGKTIKIYLIYMVLPFIIFIALMFGLGLLLDNLELNLILVLISPVIIGIYVLFITPVIAARMADNYLDYCGDIDSDYKEEIIENEHTITRNM